MKITFLAENKTESADFSAEHGLSVYIETDEMNLLFDTGASDIFMKNAIKAGKNLEETDAVVISHGHYDHAGGVPYFCEKYNAPVYIHKNSFSDFHGLKDGKVKEKGCGIPWQPDKLEDRLILTEDVIKLTDNIIISGTVPDIDTGYENEKFYKKNVDGSYTEDDMSHEQFLAVRNGDKGVFLFSGCSHKGIRPVIEYGKKLFPGEKIAGVIAGLHLFRSDNHVRNLVAEELKELDPDVVIPVHCTGIEGICTIKEVLGDKCIPATAGKTYEY